MRSAARMVTVVTVGILATTLGVAARHHGYRGHGTGSAQGDKGTGDQATGDNGTGNTHDTSANDLRRDGKWRVNRTGDLSGSSGKDDGLDLRITVFQGRARNLHTWKDRHDPKGGANGKPEISDTPLSAMTGAGHDGHPPHGVHHEPKFLAKQHDGPQRNAIGSLVDHNKIGEHHGAALSPANSLNTSGAGGWRGDGKAPAADGAHNPVNPENIGDQHVGHHIPVVPGPITADAPNVNGTTMIHPHWNTGAVGGPVKFVAGVINGTDFHRHHP